MSGKAPAVPLPPSTVHPTLSPFSLVPTAVKGRRVQSVLVLVTVLAIACCGERVRLYTGPPRPSDASALLTNQWEFYGPRVFIVRVDDTVIPRGASTCEVELPPGPHAVEFGYYEAHGHSIDNAVLTLDAQPGHHYEARADPGRPSGAVWGRVG